MSEHDLDPLPSDLRELLEVERIIPAAPDHRARVHARLAHTLGLVGPAGGGSDGPPPEPPLAPTAAPPPVHLTVRPSADAATVAHATGVRALLGHPLTLVVTFLAGTGSGVALHAGLASPPAVTSAVLVAPLASPAHVDTVVSSAVPGAPPVTTASSPLAPVATPDAPRPTSLRTSAALEPSASASGRDLDLASERALLDVARTAVGRGQADAALAALGRHAREFPRGRLREEREALTVQALAQSGRTTEAEQYARGFRKAFPNSLLGDAVAAAASASNSVTDSSTPPKPTR